MNESYIIRSKSNIPTGNKQYLQAHILKKMEESFGNRLSKQRKVRGLTQVQLAEKLGISHPSVVKWETDRTFPEVPKLIKIAKALNCSIDYLLKGSMTRPPESDEIVEIMKDSLKSKNYIIEKQEEEIEELREEVAKYNGK